VSNRRADDQENTTMSNESKPKIENLPEPEQELTPEQAEAPQGGVIAVSHEITSLSAKPTIEIGLRSGGDAFVAYDP
jgi:hypothetical protein